MNQSFNLIKTITLKKLNARLVQNSQMVGDQGNE